MINIETLHTISGESDVPIRKVVHKGNKLGYDSVQSISLTKFLSHKFHERVVRRSNPTIELVVCLEVCVPVFERWCLRNIRVSIGRMLRTQKPRNPFRLYEDE